MKLLIVEDNQAMRRMLANLLQDVAETIYECEDGAQAFSAYAVHQPDWVLMDIKLPVLDGLTATRAIRLAWPTANIVIVTGLDDRDLQQAAQQAGACAYVRKENLLEVRRILGQVV